MKVLAALFFTYFSYIKSYGSNRTITSLLLLIKNKGGQLSSISKDQHLTMEINIYIFFLMNYFVFLRNEMFMQPDVHGWVQNQISLVNPPGYLSYHLVLIKKCNKGCGM